MADTTHSRSKRGLLVVGAVSLWVVGLMWTLAGKSGTSSPSRAAERDFAPDEASDAKATLRPPEAAGDEPVSEITVEVGPSEAELASRAALVDPNQLVAPVEEPSLPTYPVWFESERELGVCKVSYEGGSKTANLHVAARLPEGELNFAYRCGKHRGRASIEVEPKRINGVLFCEDAGSVKVETVRSKDGRCASR